MKFSRVVRPVTQRSVTVEHFGDIAIASDTGKASLDDAKQPVKLGRWMFYLPRRQLKFFHARHGMIDCTHAVRPTDQQDIPDTAPVGRYIMGDWRRALNTSIYRRLAEIWLVSARLWRAGLGPQPLGVCFADHLYRDGEALGPTCGLVSQNVAKMPRKLDCHLEHIQAAGVQPDQILSCVRQQRRGYVIDLCSVVGCQPVGADDYLERLESALQDRGDTSPLVQLLEQALQESD